MIGFGDLARRARNAAVHEKTPADDPSRGRPPAAVLLGFVAALLDHFGNGAVRGAKLQRTRTRRRQYLAAIGLDLLGGSVLVVNRNTPMVEPRAGACELGFGGVLAVIDHEGEVDMPIGQMARDVLAVAAGLGVLEAEDFGIELSCLFKVIDLDGEMDNA